MTLAKSSIAGRRDLGHGQVELPLASYPELVLLGGKKNRFGEQVYPDPAVEKEEVGRNTVGE